MAPVPSQHSLHIFTLRQHQNTIPTKPINKAAKYISISLFLKLFAGTVCIFILSVLFWKTGRFLRSFTQHKVLRRGNSRTTRYAKTWYGWIPLQQHEANKNVFRRCRAKVCSLAAWRTSTEDYRWVWWDPNQKALKQYKEKRMPLQWLPHWIRSYNAPTADMIWNPGKPPNGSLASSIAVIAGNSTHHLTERAAVVARQKSALDNHPIPQAMDNELGGWAAITRQRNRRMMCSRFSINYSSDLGIQTSRKVMSLNMFASSNWEFSSFLRRQASLPHSISLPCILLSRSRPEVWHLNLAKAKVKSRSSEAAISSSLTALKNSRKYQIWSAQMGLKTLKYIGYSRHTLPGAPPGSPNSALLGSLSLANGTCGLAYEAQRLSDETCPSGSLSLSPVRMQQHRYAGRHRLSVRQVGSWSIQGQYPHRSVTDYYTSFLTPLPPPTNEHQDLAQGDGQNKLTKYRTQEYRKSLDDCSKAMKRSPQYIVHIMDLSHWEIRLIDGLDRKLHWLSDQLSPGRRPFHFALLANHWLNRETWVVFDPVSRVSIDARRQLGDPRFNVPYPKPGLAPKPKYPQTYPQQAKTPRINSWRIAMNKHRRASGLKDFIKPTQLYDSSAEDPPDGRVDPASWILRKPPQGFSLSARQQDTYYEGGAGWQEKYSDWQKVQRGYRIRKAIFEGRVNRNRAKEIAFGISRYYRMAASKKGANS